MAARRRFDVPMNASLLIHEFLVLGLAFLISPGRSWLSLAARAKLGYTAAAGVGLILLYSLFRV